MEQLKPWYVLDIDVSNAIRDDFDFSKLLADAEAEKSAPVHMWQFHLDNMNQIYTNQWLQYMTDIGFPVRGTLIFYRSAGYQHTTMHIDSPHTATGKLGLAINWSIPPDDGEMVWYEFPSTGGRYDVTETGSKYHDWPGDASPEIARRCIGSTPTIVRVDIPHNVIMHTHPRWLISARIDCQPDTWDQAVNLIKPLIIE